MTTCGHVGSVEFWNIKVVKPTGSYWGDLWRRMCRLRSQSRRHLIVTNWAAERSFTNVNNLNVLIHTGERPFSCSVCGYQCRRDCDFKLHMRRHKSPTAVYAQHVRWSSKWPIDYNSFLFVSSHIYTINCSHLQPICMCFKCNLFFIHCILIAANYIHWAPSLKELSKRLYSYSRPTVWVKKK